jgi:predicted 3-demethylubiquinone-9 3-methyltransferase (glyoxalase superfamily)
MSPISTCLWFDAQAEEAARLYMELFGGGGLGRVARYPEAAARQAQRPVGSAMTVEFAIANIKAVGLNGGPLFRFSPAFSFFLSCESLEEIDFFWSRLSSGGAPRMALGKYPWSEKYGWTTDKFGVEWQLILAPGSQKVAPCFLFTDALYGKGRQALEFYANIFPDSKIEAESLNPKTGMIAHCAFSLNGQSFRLMEGDGKHGFSFNESMSLVVTCDTQDEIDAYWSRLTVDGGEPSRCGWLKDKFGVSWQVVPANLATYASHPEKFEKAIAAVMKMAKLDMAAIDRAASG